VTKEGRQGVVRNDGYQSVMTKTDRIVNEFAISGKTGGRGDRRPGSDGKGDEVGFEPGRTQREWERTGNGVTLTTASRWRSGHTHTCNNKGKNASGGEKVTFSSSHLAKNKGGLLKTGGRMPRKGGGNRKIHAIGEPPHHTETRGTFVNWLKGIGDGHRVRADLDYVQKKKKRTNQELCRI